MAITLSQGVRAYSNAGVRGHVDVTVTGRNESNEPILNSSGLLGFYLQDLAGNHIQGFHRIPPGGPDMGGPIQRGETFERAISFDTGPVNVQQQYVLTCRHLETGDFVKTTFDFIPIYLQSGGQPPFAPAQG